MLGLRGYHYILLGYIEKTLWNMFLLFISFHDHCDVNCWNDFKNSLIKFVKQKKMKVRRVLLILTKLFFLEFVKMFVWTLNIKLILRLSKLSS